MKASMFSNSVGKVAKDYLKKGSKVYIEGKLQTRKWQDKSGVDHYTTEIVANELNMIDVRQQNLDKTLEIAPPVPRGLISITYLTLQLFKIPLLSPSVNSTISFA